MHSFRFRPTSALLAAILVTGFGLIPTAIAAEPWTWIADRPPFGTDNPPLVERYLDGIIDGAVTSDGSWLVSEDFIRSSDGWTLDPSVFIPGFQLNAVGAAGDIAYFVGAGTKILRYDGLARSWESSGAATQLESVWVDSSGEAIVGAWNYFLHRDNGVWTEHPSPVSTAPTSIWGTSMNDVWAATSGGLLHWDGNTWSTAIAFSTKSVCGDDTGTVYAMLAGGQLKRWDGDWTDLGTDFPDHQMVCTGDGQLFFREFTRDSLWTTTDGFDKVSFRWFWGEIEGMWAGSTEVYVTVERSCCGPTTWMLFRIDGDQVTNLGTPEASINRVARNGKEFAISGIVGERVAYSSYELDGILVGEPGRWTQVLGEYASGLWLGDDGEIYAGVDDSVRHFVDGVWSTELQDEWAGGNFLVFEDGSVLTTARYQLHRKTGGVWTIDHQFGGRRPVWASGPDDIYVHRPNADGMWFDGGSGWQLVLNDYEIDVIAGTGPDDVIAIDDRGVVHYRQDGQFSQEDRGFDHPRNLWLIDDDTYGFLDFVDGWGAHMEFWLYEKGLWLAQDDPDFGYMPLAWSESGTSFAMQEDTVTWEFGCPSLPGGARWGGPQLDTFADIELDGPMVYVAGTLGSWGSIGGNDAHIVAYRRGERLWNRAYGNTEEDRFYDLEPTTDGGVIAVGRQQLSSGDHQAWAIKLDRDGVREWAKLFGSAGFDSLNAVRQRIDGRFVAVGETPGSDGEADGWVIELAADGTLERSTTFGGPGEDVLTDLQIKSWGGLVAVGRTSSGPYGQLDGWLLSFGHSADTLYFQRFYGGGIDDGLEAIAETPDGWAIAGWAKSFGNGISKGWIVGLEPTFGRRFSRAYGGLGDDRFLDIDVDSEGRLVTAGRTTSFGNARQAWLQVADPNGNRLYAELHGGAGEDDFQAAAVGCARDSITAVGASTTNGVGGSRDAWAKTPDHSQAKAWIGQFRNLLQSRGLSGELVTITTDPQSDPSFDLIRYLEGTAYLRPLDSFDDLYQAAADIIARARPTEDADSDGTLNADDPDPFNGAFR